MPTEELVKIGQILGNRYEITKKLGQGGCGTVYECLDTVANVRAALKVEANDDINGTALKMEIEVLTRLKNKRNVAKIISCGNMRKYSYFVMTLLGKSLSTLSSECGAFKPGTLARIGAQVLFGLKNLHEAGFVHRDVKPANLAIGRKHVMIKVVHILDFGLCRELANFKGNISNYTRARKVALFRGTFRYCSLNAQKQKEQGRQDDLISLAYVLAECIDYLPWSEFSDKLEIALFKQQTKDNELFPEHDSLANFLTYAKTLSYEDKPDYEKCFLFFDKIIQESRLKFSDPYDWETLFGEEEEPVITNSRESKDIHPVYVYKKSHLNDIYCRENFKNKE
uniref:Protein kinase domain-containing protein n=1 Tax=Strongyloides papillosus TaxID=174720 RepID=A0A0N5CF71_STREA